MNIKIVMTHEDGHTNTQIRKAENVESTVALAKTCGYVKFKYLRTNENSKSGR